MRARIRERPRNYPGALAALCGIAVILWLVSPTVEALATSRVGHSSDGLRIPGPAASATSTSTTTTTSPSTSLQPATTTTGPRTTVTAPPTTTSAPPTSTSSTVRSNPTTTMGPGQSRSNPGETTTTVPPAVSSTTTTTPTLPTSSVDSTTTTQSLPPVTTTKEVPTDPALAGCQADPAATIAALPAGSVFVGSGCYITSGILISKPVTIDGGVYNDPVITNAGDGSVHPIIRIKDTTGVTIENTILTGANVSGGFHRHLVGQAGLDILSSSGVSITNVSVCNTFGDGLTAFANFPVNKNPTTGLRVNGLFITNAGREGITMAYIKDSFLNDVAINSSSDSGWDFESDLPGIGSGNVTVTNSRSTKGVRLIEALQGPITFDNYNGQRHVTLLDEAAASGQPITFNGGSLLLPNTDNGMPPAGITVRGPGRLALNGVAVGRLPAVRPPKGPAWSVTEGGSLIIHSSLVASPLGTNDQTSSVTMTY